MLIVVGALNNMSLELLWQCSYFLLNEAQEIYALIGKPDLISNGYLQRDMGLSGGPMWSTHEGNSPP